jgi:hypothetical protein
MAQTLVLGSFLTRLRLIGCSYGYKLNNFTFDLYGRGIR